MSKLHKFADGTVVTQLRVPGTCVDCGCTDDDCSQCIEASGQPCFWANEERDLCSRCADDREAA